MTESKICTCPSGDGSLRWPCPAHPAEQAGGDERAAFRPAQVISYRPGVGEVTIYVAGRVPGYMNIGDTVYVSDRAPVEQPIAALAQPSPVSEALIYACKNLAQITSSDGSGHADIALAILRMAGVCDDERERLVNEWKAARAWKPSPAQAEQAEAERPEVAEVAFVLRNIGAMDAEDIDGDNVDLRFEDAEGRDTGCDVSIVEYAEKAADLFEQHDRIVGELRADRDSWAEQAEQRLADWDEMRKERDAALARVAELERQEPVAHLRASDLERLNQPGIAGSAGSLWNGPREGFVPLYAAPVAQAQQLHDLDKQCRDDVARALGLRPSQERGFAWSYLLASIKSCVKASGDSAQAQHSVPETTNEEANSFLRVADAGQFKDNAAAVRTAAMIIRGLLHRPAIMKSIIRHRIGLTPEYEGQWHADLYGEDGEVQHHAEADTPDEAVRAVVALAAAPGKEGV